MTKTLTRPEAIDRLVDLHPDTTAGDWEAVAAQVAAAGWHDIASTIGQDWYRPGWGAWQWKRRRTAVFDPTAPGRAGIDVTEVIGRGRRRRIAEALRRPPVPATRDGIDPWRAPESPVS